MADRKLTFEDACHYAELRGYAHREDPSRAKDYTGKFFRSPWTGYPIMVLYEAPRRIPKGKDKPEVMWWVMDSLGDIAGIYSRNIRLMEEAKGMPLGDSGYNKIVKVLNGYKEDNENV